MASLQRYLPGNLVYRPVIQDLFISLHPFYFFILDAKTAITFEGAMQWDFDDLILVSTIIQHFWRQTFFLLFSSKECQNIT